MSHRPEEFDDQTRLENLAPAQLLRLNQCCDRFERGWQPDGSPQIASFLDSLSPAERTLVAPELVLIDIESRRRHGFPLDADAYLRECPELDPGWLVARLKGAAETIEQPEARTELQPGQRLGDYRILGPLGAGGMGRVYRAEHQLMKRIVALKVIREQKRMDPLAQRRFEREVHSIARLNHPNIVAAWDARQDEGWLYLVTELVEGEDLGKLVRRKGPLSPLRAAHCIWQAAKGLQYAHQQGIVHRDIKPENLLYDRKQNVKILDLGLARWQSGQELTNAEQSLTQSDQILGTVRYMSPEQARAPAMADARNDVYSLGCTLFFLLTGRPPYTGASMLETMLAHVESPVPSAAEFSASGTGAVVPARLDDFVKQMMSKHPADRPASMQVVVDELSAIVRELQSQAAPSLVGKAVRIKPGPVPLDKSRRLGWRSALARIAASVVATLGVAAAVFFLWPFGEREPSVQPAEAGASGNATPLPAITNAGSAGLAFNGRSSYVSVTDFASPTGEYLAIEAVCVPDRQNGPANLVSWTGPRTLVLFRSFDGALGVAHFDGQRSHLVMENRPLVPGEKVLVAGTWDGKRLRLMIDGAEVPTRPTEYVLNASNPSLYMGGIPAGILPVTQGPRFFAGSLLAVRISQSRQPIAIANSAEQLIVNNQTVALFPLREGRGATTVDQSDQHWAGTLHNAEWMR